MRQNIKLQVSFLTVLLVFTVNLADSRAKCPVRMGSLYLPNQFSVISQRGSVNKYPENTLPSLKDALYMEGANALKVDLSLTSDGKVILWRYWNLNGSNVRKKVRQLENSLSSNQTLKGPNSKKRISGLTFMEFIEKYGYDDKTTFKNSKIQILTFQNFMDWATQQSKLKLVLFKLTIPKEESHLAPVLLKEIRRVMGTYSGSPHFELIFLTSHKEVLNLLKNHFGEFQFSYDREITSVNITNYHAYTTVPEAMEYKNKFSSIGLSIENNPSKASAPDPWDIYKFILTLDFKIRDNYKRSTGNNIKIFSWTFNDEKKIRCLINLGVDGIVTHDPKLARKIALEMGKILD